MYTLVLDIRPLISNLSIAEFQHWHGEPATLWVSILAETLYDILLGIAGDLV